MCGAQAENCFVDAALRVKVADFGTGRLAASLARRPMSGDGDDPSARHKSGSSEEWSPVKAWSEGDKMGRSLSRGVGSLLWMAPEALRGSRVKEGQAPALDVYVHPTLPVTRCTMYICTASRVHFVSTNHHHYSYHRHHLTSSSSSSLSSHTHTHTHTHTHSLTHTHNARAHGPNCQDINLPRGSVYTLSPSPFAQCGSVASPKQ